MRYVHYSPDNSGVLATFYEPTYERLVNLQGIHREPLEVREGRVASSEIVDLQSHPEPPKPFERFYRGLGVILYHALCNLQGQTARLEPGLLKDFVHFGHEPGTVELSGRDIYANHEGRVTRVSFLPLAHLTAGFPEHPVSQGDDQARLRISYDTLLSYAKWGETFCL